MSSLSAKDRVSLCSFTFSDGRRCRTPRSGKHPHFCFYHAQKEARARTAEKLGKDLAYFFSGNYNYRFPPALKPEQPAAAPEQSASPQPQPQPAQTSVNCHSSLATHHSPLPHAPQPAPSPHTSLPPTSAEFVRHVEARLQTGGGQAPQPAPTQARSPIPTQTTPTPALAPSQTSAHAPQTPASQPTPSAPACHYERSEGSSSVFATSFTRSVAPAAQRNNPPPTASPTPKLVLPLDSRALHFDHNCRLRIDGKPF